MQARIRREDRIDDDACSSYRSASPESMLKAQSPEDIRQHRLRNEVQQGLQRLEELRRLLQ